MTTPVTSLETAKEFIKSHMDYVGGGFNPDTDFADYVYDGRNETMYAPNVAAEMNAELEKARDFFEEAGEDIYEYCLSQL